MVLVAKGSAPMAVRNFLDGERDWGGKRAEATLMVSGGGLSGFFLVDAVLGFNHWLWSAGLLASLGVSGGGAIKRALSERKLKRLVQEHTVEIRSWAGMSVLSYKRQYAEVTGKVSGLNSGADPVLLWFDQRAAEVDRMESTRKKVASSIKDVPKPNWFMRVVLRREVQLSEVEQQVRQVEQRLRDEVKAGVEEARCTWHEAVVEAGQRSLTESRLYGVLAK